MDRKPWGLIAGVGFVALAIGTGIGYFGLERGPARETRDSVNPIEVIAKASGRTTTQVRDALEHYRSLLNSPIDPDEFLQSIAAIAECWVASHPTEPFNVYPTSLSFAESLNAGTTREQFIETACSHARRTAHP